MRNNSKSPAMSALISQTARLIPYAKRPKRLPGYVTAFAYEPEPDDPAAGLGNIYAVIEILVPGRAAADTAELIIQTIGEHYYQLAPKGQTTDQANDPNYLTTRFESSLKAANRALAGQIMKGQTTWIGKLSAVITVQSGSQFHLTHAGSGEAWLYRGTAKTHLTNTPPTSRRPNPGETFTSIASGELESGDHLLFATPALIHQLPLARLHTVVAHSSPTTAINEINQLLSDNPADTDRIAALVVEITTPEQAALQVRSDQPDEIELGAPTTALQAAKYAAAPIATTTATSGRKVAATANTHWQRLKPRATSVLQTATHKLRSSIKSPRTPHVITAAVIIAAIITTVIIIHHNNTQAAQHQISGYQSAYQTYLQADQQIIAGNKDGARQSLQKLQQQLNQFTSQETSLNHNLAKTKLSNGEPSTLQAFRQLIADKLDALDGLKKITSTFVANLSSSPTRLELIGNQAYVIGSTIQTINLSSATAQTSSANLSTAGSITASTIASTNDALYLLSTKPSIWRYDIDTQTLSEQTIKFSTWPPATAVAAYLGNLYLLGTDHIIYKHLPTAVGYSPKNPYITPDQTKTLTGATALAVDGYVYALTPTGLQQYLAGQPTLSAPVPDALKDATILHSFNNGQTLLAVSTHTNRLALWSVTAKSITFTGQYQLSNVKDLRDAAYDPRTGTIYALTATSLVRFNP